MAREWLRRNFCTLKQVRLAGRIQKKAQMIGFGFGGMEMWIVLGIALLLFGHRIPGMARALGSGIVEFKKGLSGEPDPNEQLQQAPPSSEKSD